MAVCSGMPGSADILNFSDVAVSGSYREFLGASFDSLGYTFTTTSLDNVVDSGDDTNPLRTPADGQNVYAVFLTPTGGGAFAPTVGGVFDLVSLDAVWWNHNYINGAEDFTIAGNFADGTTQSFSGSVAKGSYQSVVLNWTDLTSVSFDASGGFGWFALGNIDVRSAQTAPEPDSWLATALALAVVIASGKIRNGR